MWQPVQVADFSRLQWVSDTMTVNPDSQTLDKAIAIAKTAQIAEFVRNNQMLTALGLFVLWQTGAFLSAYGQVQGAVC